MTPDRALELVALGIFVLALVHTFAAKQLERLSRRFPRHAGLFHLLGEVEVVFGFWAIVLVLAMVAMTGGAQALAYAESRNYTEPLFVFVVMVMAASRPILQTVIRAVDWLAGCCRWRHRSPRPGWAWPRSRCSDRWSPSPRR